jgi:predicted DNA-binding transcriptional regulator AlpA
VNADPLLSWPTLSCWARLSLGTLLRLQASDPTFPPAIDVGGRVVFRRADVERWLASRAQASTSK